MKSISRRPLLVLLAVLLLIVGGFELHLLTSLSELEDNISSSSSISSYVEHFKQSNTISLEEEAFVNAFSSTSPWKIGNVFDRCHEFETLINHSHDRPKLNIVVFHGSYEKTTAQASTGSSMGELTYWKEVLFALCLIDANRTFLTSQSATLEIIHHDQQATNSSFPEVFDVLITDVYSLIALREDVSFANWFADPWNKCRLRILDDWGTPDHQNHMQMNLQQYWVPWSCANSSEADISATSSNPPLSVQGNYLLGHYVLPARSNKRHVKKIQGMVWGKEYYYFQSFPIIQLLKAIAEEVPLFMTARPNAEGLFDSKNITNLGIVSQSEREQLLEDSLFLIGVGDPVVGLTPFEAMSHGVVYLNPIYYEPRRFWMNPTCPYNNQHPATTRLTPPNVFHYQLEVTGGTFMVDNVRQIVRHIVANYRSNNHIKPFIDPFLTLNQFMKRLSDSLYDQHICAGS